MTEQVGLRAHGLGGDDAEQLVEGMSIQSLEGASQAYFDDMLQSEITIMTSAIPADTSGGGIRMNSVLKDGGNIFSGAAFLGFSSGTGRARTTATSCAPLRAASTARTRSSTFTCSPDRWAVPSSATRCGSWSRRGISRRTRSSPTCLCRSRRRDGEVINSYLDTYVRGPSLRLTWQAAQKHKLATFVQRWWKRKGKDFGAGQDPRASQFRDPKHAHHTVGNIRWTSPMTQPPAVRGGLFVDVVRLAGRADARRRTAARHTVVVRQDAERPTRSGRWTTSAPLPREQRDRGLHHLGIQPDPAAGQHAPCVSGGRVLRHRFA